VATGNRGGPEVTRILLLAGADVNAVNQSKRTPLHNAASWCTIESVEMLLDAGADPYLVDDDGRTALDATCKQPAQSRSVVVDLLRKAMSK
jgi:ankyrin repeat protein